MMQPDHISRLLLAWATLSMPADWQAFLGLDPAAAAAVVLRNEATHPNTTIPRRIEGIRVVGRRWTTSEKSS